MLCRVYPGQPLRVVSGVNMPKRARATVVPQNLHRKHLDFIAQL